jgi:integrase
VQNSLGGWHDFRHTVATSLLRAGHGVKVVSPLLGHSDVAITLRTYDHVESDALRAPLNQAAKPSCYESCYEIAFAENQPL